MNPPRVTPTSARWARLVPALLLVCLGPGLLARADEPRSPRIFLVGDSTVKNGTRGQQGWGDPFAALVDSPRVRVENRARGGRSSRTFLTEGLWDRALAEIEPGDFVLIQFGHNDGGPLTEGRARASLKGNGEETREVPGKEPGKTEVVHTYGWYLRKYAADVKAKGATPIIVTPVPRNIWKGGTVALASNDYGKWAAEAARQAGAPLLDLNELVAKKYEEIGRETVASQYFGSADHTHTTPAGAKVTAAVVVEGLKALKIPALERLLPATGATP